MWPKMSAVEEDAEDDDEEEMGGLGTARGLDRMGTPKIPVLVSFVIRLPGVSRRRVVPVDEEDVALLADWE